MKLSARDQIIIFVIVTLLAAVAIFFFLILPRFGEIAEAEVELIQIQAETDQVKTVLQRRQDAKAQAAETQVQLLDIATRFPEAPQLPALIIELQDVANNVGIEFIQLAPGTPGPVERVDNVHIVPVTLSITGDWEQFIELMAALDGVRRELRVLDFAVSSVPPQSDEEEDAGGDGDAAAADDEASDEPEVYEEQIYTISARVQLQAYMMDAEIKAAGDAAAP